MARLPRPALAVVAGLAVAALVPGGVPGRAASSLPRVQFVAGPGGSILVHGTYPRVPSPCRHPARPVLHARFQGTVEVGRDRDGRLFIVNILPFERYLEGIAEVPRTWPMEALEAQAVAARTYALARLARPDATARALGYQLCATDACQVYRGMGVGFGPYGERWRRAVAATAGQVLLYRGKPADTVYFSTSNGRTLGNEQVFGTAALPYLRPVVERDDGASPLSRWRVRMPLGDVARFLRAAGHWPARPVAAVTLRGGELVVRGGGVRRSMTVAAFRDDLNRWAPCLDPDRYPTVNDNGVRLPQTVPSVWFRASSAGGSLVLTGRGWGHGVGMVQWGAYGKARRGLSYRDILAYYYGGLRPTRVPEPREIRVGVAVGLSRVVVEGSGPVELLGARGAPPVGPWLVLGGAGLIVRPSGPPPSFVRAGAILRAPRGVRAGRVLSATVDLPQLSVVRLVLQGEGREVAVGHWVTAGPGQARVSGRVPSLPSGTYSLRAEVTDGIDVARTDPLPLRIRGTPPSPTPPSPSPAPPTTPAPTGRAAPSPPRAGAGRGSRALPIALGAAAAALAGAAAVAGWRARRAGRD